MYEETKQKRSDYQERFANELLPVQIGKNSDRKVFISYAWEEKSDKIATQIEAVLNHKNIEFIRDKKVLGFKDHIKEFMRTIGQGQCVILIISEKYLKSDNCMFELLQIATNRKFYERVFPIILDDAKIYDPVDRIEYVQYWEHKLQKLDRGLKSVSTAHLEGFREDVDLYSDIRDNIPRLTYILKDMNLLNVQIHCDSGFAELIQAVEKKLDEIDIQKFDSQTRQKIIQEELNPSLEQEGVSLSAGVNALLELMQIDKVRSSVIIFRTDFQAACEQLDVIADYKILHDLLHALENQYYRGIIQEIRRFPEDENSIDNLTEYHFELQKVLRDVKDVATRESIATSELIWLEDLDLAQTEMLRAIEEGNLERLKRTVWLLNRILAIQPSRINTNLNASARALRLPALVSAMQHIWGSFSTSCINQDKISQFKQGVEVLDKLNKHLNVLIDSHNSWQELDLELRRIDANLDRDMIELEMAWTHLKCRTNALLNNSSDEWTISFQQESNKLDQTLKTKNSTEIRRTFRGFRRKARERFFQVDVSLKRICEELRKVGEPLTSVLRMME